MVKKKPSTPAPIPRGEWRHFKLPHNPEEVQSELNLLGIPSRFNREEERFYAPLSSRNFRAVVKRTLCRKFEREKGTGIPVYPFEWAVNTKMVNWLSITNGPAFHVMPGSDTARFNAYIASGR